ncbi:MAG: hypothetical protein ABEH78_07310 [Haloferacaceae archaeon]
MSLWRLLPLRSPADFADWVRVGAEYVRDVTDGMGFDAPPLDARTEAAVRAMRADRTDVRPPVARLITADLLADAAFADPFCQWTPLWYELALAGPNALAARRLRRLARRYAADSDLDAVAAPRFSRPGDVLVDGRPATAGVEGFGDRFVLASAVLHLEWYVHVAREAGVEVPRALVARTRRASAAYYAGARTDLPDEVRRFQRLLFADDAWVRGVDEAYGLDSALFSVWERLLREARRDLNAVGP